MGKKQKAPTSDAWFDAALTGKPRKIAVSLRLDEDVVVWVKSFGPGYQTRINAMLRGCMEHAKGKAK